MRKENAGFSFDVVGIATSEDVRMPDNSMTSFKLDASVGFRAGVVPYFGSTTT